MPRIKCSEIYDKFLFLQVSILSGDGGPVAENDVVVSSFGDMDPFASSSSPGFPIFEHPDAGESSLVWNATLPVVMGPPPTLDPERRSPMAKKRRLQRVSPPNSSNLF